MLTCELTPDVANRLSVWRERPEISARSVLVTILGDVVMPATHTFWLAQAFALGEPFGFNARLVRTSVSRLATERWLSRERVGREAKYSLTPEALLEIRAAGVRIYEKQDPVWDGRWTMLILDREGSTRRQRERLSRHLRWHGFASLDRCLLAAPSVAPTLARELVGLIEPSVRVAVLRGEVIDAEDVVQVGAFSTEFVQPETERGYEEFVSNYEPLVRLDLSGLEPVDAFVLRTMLVHDLRRVALRSPSIPRELLPTPWAGDAAFAIACQTYHRLCEASAPFLDEVFQTGYPRHFTDRFA